MPTIPNRLDYLNWIKSIWRSHVSPGDTFNLIDIGTGYLPIYPILAARLFDNCLVYATDIDHSSLELAASNIDRNNLDDKIKLVGVDRDDNNLIPSEITDNHAQFDFLIMNPPFYDAGQVSRQNIKSNHPSGLNLGSTNELYTEGGELGFILKLINQSIKLKHKVVWYSTLIGIKSNLSILIKYLNKHNISNYALNVINRGNTLRWLLAWSFLPYRLDNSLARSNNKSLFKLNPPSTHHTHNLNHPINLDAMISLINQLSSVYISHRSEGNSKWAVGSNQTIKFDVDTENKAEIWNKFSIDLMTGPDLYTVFVGKVAENISVPNKDQGKINWTLPDTVTPHSQIYFLQFYNSENATDKAWSTRFTITGENGDSEPPSHETQPKSGKDTPWGIGSLREGPIDQDTLPLHHNYPASDAAEEKIKNGGGSKQDEVNLDSETSNANGYNHSHVVAFVATISISLVLHFSCFI
ncbi:Putative methyltransferase-like protein C27D7.08c [Wallemia ichthyophaga EXF-994]|uniref:Putative methyltransferase-like protein C27D7.08c n=1 Tax=Wallemia ichthyophaga (strain EXF-994 / CBS 113033) TaxID=1299270 RepID=R9AEC4_WALI9|nr:Putative methyltransferase-like protein C27D7.08c [Wallemia ichthyophaga EXF-994]EOR00554.1 Putative methyltransferase-like protein C27D7.08c [Wallemia ichthyophaga EXF-994]